MKLIPLNLTVLCRMIVKSKTKIDDGTLAYEKEDMPVYEVIDVSNIDVDIKPLDKIITNSIPSKVKIGDEYFYLIRQEYIAGKIV